MPMTDEQTNALANRLTRRAYRELGLVADADWNEAKAALAAMYDYLDRPAVRLEINLALPEAIRGKLSVRTKALALAFAALQHAGD